MHTDIHARTSDSSSTARYSSPNQKRRMRQQHLNSVYAVARRNKSCQKIPKTMKFYQTGWSHGANRRVVRYNLPTDMLAFYIHFTYTLRFLAPCHGWMRFGVILIHLEYYIQYLSIVMNVVVCYTQSNTTLILAPRREIFYARRECKAQV